ncbi:MAG: thioredoxin domain-containing protein, partial [bacterium]|nr:thioredoxin domain-containing protein [bacterium]
MSSNIKQAILWVVGALVFLGIIIGIAIATTPNGGGSSTPQTSEIRPTAEDWIKGSIDATVQIVEYSDLQCPACAGYEP